MCFLRAARAHVIAQQKPNLLSASKRRISPLHGKTLKIPEGLSNEARLKFCGTNVLWRVAASLSHVESTLAHSSAIRLRSVSAAHCKFGIGADAACADKRHHGVGDCGDRVLIHGDVQQRRRAWEPKQLRKPGHPSSGNNLEQQHANHFRHAQWFRRNIHAAVWSVQCQGPHLVYGYHNHFKPHSDGDLGYPAAGDRLSRNGTQLVGVRHL
jgi:hypothetical protein